MLARNKLVCNMLASEEVEYEKCTGSSNTRTSHALAQYGWDSVFALISNVSLHHC